MAKDEVVPLPNDGSWVEITDEDVSALTVQNQSGNAVYLRGTAGNVSAPATRDGYMLNPGTYLMSDIPLTTLFAGVAGVNRVWARCDIGGSLRVSHE